jgi:2C-methyl-D-erythritol 2,4-cyclodiphosphate synthase
MKKQLILLALAATLINALAGCAGTDWRAVRRDAATILGKVAVAQLRTLVAGNLGSDYGHAAASAAWGAVDVADIGQLVRSATGHPAAAKAVESIAAEALATNRVSKSTVINAVATALSEAAFAGAK